MSIFKERQIMINLNTNAYMKTNPNDSEQNIVFKSSMLKLPEISFSPLEEYPYFTSELQYPESFLKRLPYHAKLEFFFNRGKFVEILTKNNQNFVQKETEKYHKLKQEIEEEVVGGALETPEELEERKQNEKKYDKTNDIVKTNIAIMLKCIFPTKYPYTFNFKTSYDLKISKSLQLKFEIPKIISKFFLLNSDKEYDELYPEYSYLKLDGKTYTVSEVIWVNDIYNHPKYNTIFKSYNDLLFFKKTYTSILKNEIEKQKKSLKNIKNEFLTENEPSKTFIEEIEELLANIKKKLETEGTKSKRTDYNGNIYNEYAKDISLIERILNYIKEIIDLLAEPINYTKLNDKLQLLINDISIYEQNSNPKNTQGYGYNVYNPYLEYPQILINFFQKIKQLKEINDEIKNNIYVFETYLKPNKLTKRILKESDSIRKTFEKYLSFFDSLTKFKNTMYATNNQYLQNLIDNYNTNNDNENKFLKLLNPNYIHFANKPFDTYIDSIYSGVNINVTDNTAEIYVRMDVIEGEVTDENTGDITCVYPGEKLTDKLDTLVSTTDKSWQLNPRRMFFVLDEKKAYSKIGVNAQQTSAETEKKESPTGEPTKKVENESDSNKKVEQEAPGWFNPGMFQNMFRGYGGTNGASNRKNHGIKSLKHKKNTTSTRKLKAYYMNK